TSSRMADQPLPATSGLSPSPLKVTIRSLNPRLRSRAASSFRRLSSMRARIVVPSRAAALRARSSSASEISTVVFIQLYVSWHPYYCNHGTIRPYGVLEIADASADENAYAYAYAYASALAFLGLSIL